MSLANPYQMRCVIDDRAQTQHPWQKSCLEALPVLRLLCAAPALTGVRLRQKHSAPRHHRHQRPAELAACQAIAVMLVTLATSAHAHPPMLLPVVVTIQAGAVV